MYELPPHSEAMGLRGADSRGKSFPISDRCQRERGELTHRVWLVFNLQKHSGNYGDAPTAN